MSALEQLGRDAPAAAAPLPRVARAAFGVAPAGTPVDAITLANGRGTEVRFITYGGVIVSVRVPDRDGALDDVALGYDALDDYLADPRYLGAIVGRYANRIARARFVLDGVTHLLTRNDGENHLHGGLHGFHAANWDAEPFVDAAAGAAGAVLRHTSPAGEDGYPGTLAVRVTYTLTAADELVVDYHAVTDRATPVSLTQHSYFNLAGHDAGDVLDHEVTLAASRFTPVDAHLVPTGELRCVRGTPFDFTAPHRLGERIGADDEQLRRADGYDHNFVLDGAEGEPAGDAAPPAAAAAPRLAARVREPRTGRTLEVLTTEPGIQLYSGNALDDGPAGKGGHPYRRRDGFALETQRFPDAPNRPNFPSAILRPGEELRSRTVYRFAAEGR